MVPDVQIDPNFYVQSDADGNFRTGQIFHIARNSHGGSMSTPIGRYFITLPNIGAEGYNTHSRMDCFVRSPPLAPAEDWLAKCLLGALLAGGFVAEPVWVSWHRAEELGGEARGAVFDLD